MKEEMSGIWELRRETEKRTGCPSTIYSAYPVIGRGSVVHDLVSSAEVEKRFRKALKVSFRQKVSFFLNRILRHA